jgi:putative sigma-54 modulation protein
MEVIIQSPHFTLNEALNSFINVKLDRLSHHYDRIESAHVLLRIEKSDPTDYKVCEIRLAVPGNDLFAKKHSDTYEDAITQVTDALQEQMGKMKNRLRHRS